MSTHVAACPFTGQSTSPADALRDHVAADAFPCVGAKAALSRGRMEILELGRLGDRRNDARLLDRLTWFARRYGEAAGDERHALHTLAAVFSGPGGTDEHRFEALLWAQLQRLHDLDAARGAPWAEDVSPDPEDPRFSLSLGGHPFFVIGLHPGASRRARRFALPAMVFNSHRQFERLRADGRYARMQAAIRQRDVALQGSINPNLADFGQASEVRQYSGREAGPEWRCPLRVRSKR